MSEVFSVLTPNAANASAELQGLVTEWNKRVDDVMVVSGSHEDLVYVAADLDILNILLQVLPYILSLFTGGFTIEAILSIVKFVVPLIVKDPTLQAILLQIIEVLVGLLIKK